MSDVVRDAVAQAIAEDLLLGGSAVYARRFDIADAAIGAYLSALGEGGYTLVALPAPDDIFDDGIREWYCDSWFVGNDRNAGVRVVTHKMNLRPATAKRLAGAILAAAEEQ